MRYSDVQRIEKMRETAQKLLAYLEEGHVTREMILAQEHIRWTITTPLYNIGEQAYRLSDEFKETHQEAPWAKISGLRHRLVHEYENTNWSLICSVLFEVLPDFLETLEKMDCQTDKEGEDESAKMGVE